MMMLKFKFTIFFSALVLLSCSSGKKDFKEEQIVVVASDNDTESSGQDTSTAVNLTLAQIQTKPSSVILTGLPNHRLVTVYHSQKGYDKYSRISSYGSSYGEEETGHWHYMPGIDLLSGYNLLNVAHYDMLTGQTNYLFQHPVLINSLYYPSFYQDSLDKKPVNRNYYLVSVYDNDSNKDSLINRKDLRHLYCFDAACKQKTNLLPTNYSVMRSQYDPQNDAMYLFATFDANNNGYIETKEPQHVFWFSLNNPMPAKRMY
jgi:hypothetical protein